MVTANRNDAMRKLLASITSHLDGFLKLGKWEEELPALLFLGKLVRIWNIFSFRHHTDHITGPLLKEFAHFAGHVDPGESDLETAFRETKEEAGFNKDDLKVVEGFKKVLKYFVNGEPKTVTYWLAELHKSTPVVLSSEHQAYKWGTLNVACELTGYKDFQDMLQECEQYITKNYNK